MSFSKEKYVKLQKIDTSSVYAELKKAIEKKSRNAYEMAVPLAAYALYIIQSNPDKDYSNFSTFQCECLADEMGEFSPAYTSHHMIEEGYQNAEDGPWEEVLKLKNKFSLDELASCVLFADKTTFLNDIPYRLDELVNGITKTKKNEQIANFYAGAGSYLVGSMLDFPNDKYFANFSIEDYGLLTYIRLKLIGKDAWLDDGADIFEGKYDRAFCQLFMSDSNIYSNAVRRFGKYKDADFPDNCSDEWKVAVMIMRTIKKSGNFSMVFRKSSIANRRDKEARKYFIERGLVKKVILLPEKLYADRGKTVLIVFSNNNKSIEFSDFTKECSSGRLKGKSIDILADVNVANICKSIGTNEYSLNVSLEDIDKTNFSLDPQKYLVRDTDEKIHYETLETLGMKVMRAAQLTALDIISEDETSVRCIMPRNIKDGVLVGPYQYIKESVASNMNKFILSPGDLLITKNGNPFKVAVYESDEPETVVANGNLYIIKKEYVKADPYYLKAFFESKSGMELLNANSQGDTVPMITLTALKDIKIPYYEKEKQQVIAARCEEITKDIREMHRSIEIECEEISNMF